MQPILLEYGSGITCIDTMYMQPGYAACYLLVQNGRAAFIDTGTGNSVPLLLDTLKQKNINIDDVDYVIPTHVHLDHAGGAGLLMSKFPNAKLIIHPRGVAHMIDPSKLIMGATAVYGKEKFKDYFGEVIPIDKERVISAVDNFEINLDDRTLKFLDTPGHARHHFCVYDKKSESVFTGDTFGLSYRQLDSDAGAFILPTTTPVQFEPDPWYTSLDKILDHKPKNIFLTHYGRITEVERLEQELRQDIAKYVEITKQYLNVEDSENKIRNEINDYLKQRLSKNYKNEKIEYSVKFLQPDISLNAAGLKIWLSRLEKAA
ncbi:MAG: MBL fold metallo-hydrolase [Pseudomonadota bacterium]